MKCRICGTVCQQQFSSTVLNKYVVAYFYCTACGFLQTEQPYWLDEAYQSAIANADTGLVQRNLHLSKLLSTLLYFQFDRQGKYLDFAGGYGMLTRLMRDAGFDYYWSDPYCQNLLARGFETPMPGPDYAAVTAFEVLEHVTDPLAFISSTLKQANSRTLIFSTELFAGSPPAPNDWWYYVFQTGQHIAFYQRRTLETIAQKLGLHCHTGNSLHILTDKTIHPTTYRLLTHPRLAPALGLIAKHGMPSKMVTDHQNIIHQNPK